MFVYLFIYLLNKYKSFPDLDFILCFLSVKYSLNIDFNI